MLDLDETPGTDVAKTKSFSSDTLLQKHFFLALVHEMVLGKHGRRIATEVEGRPRWTGSILVTDRRAVRLPDCPLLGCVNFADDPHRMTAKKALSKIGLLIFLPFGSSCFAYQAAPLPLRC